jgi:mRNA interferase RelE/StbE
VFTLEYKKQAIRALAKINEPYYTAIINAIDALAEDPRPHGHKKLSGRDGYRIRVGTYRVIYDILDNVLIVQIVAVGSRGSIYEK